MTDLLESASPEGARAAAESPAGAVTGLSREFIGWAVRHRGGRRWEADPPAEIGGGLVTAASAALLRVEMTRRRFEWATGLRSWPESYGYRREPRRG